MSMTEERENVLKTSAKDAIDEMMVLESGTMVLSGKIEIITECEGCQAPLANPVIVIFNDSDERDSAIVGKECQD